MQINFNPEQLIFLIKSFHFDLLVKIFAIAVILNILGMWVAMIFHIISFIVWIYGMYATYQEVQLVNGA